MLKYCDIPFRRGSILTKEILSELYRGPSAFLDLLYDGYADGVLEGLDISSQDGRVFIGKGLVKYGDHVYRMDAPYCVSDAAAAAALQDREYRLMMEPSVPEGTEDCMEYRLVFQFRTAEDKTPGIEFARLRPGVKALITLPKPDGNTNWLEKAVMWPQWNMAECPFPVNRSAATYHPYVFRLLRQHIQRKEKKTCLEYMVLSQIMSQGVLDYVFMLELLHDCGKKEAENGSRCEVLCAFAQALEELSPQNEASVKTESHFPRMDGKPRIADLEWMDD